MYEFKKNCFQLMLSMKWGREIVSWTTTITKDTTIELPGYKTITNGHLWYGKCSSQFCPWFYISSILALIVVLRHLVLHVPYYLLLYGKNSFCFSSKISNLDFGNVFNEMFAISCFGLVLDCRNLLLDGSLFPDPSFCILVCGYFNFWSCRRRAKKNAMKRHA